MKTVDDIDESDRERVPKQLQQLTKSDIENGRKT